MSLIFMGIENEILLEVEGLVSDGCKATHLDPSEAASVDDLSVGSFFYEGSMPKWVELTHFLSAQQIKYVEDLLIERSHEGPQNDEF